MKIKIFIIVTLNIIISFFVNLITSNIPSLSGVYIALIIFVTLLLGGVVFYATSYDTQEEKAFYKIFKFGSEGLDLVIEESNRKRSISSSIAEVYKNIKDGNIEEATKKQDMIERMNKIEGKIK